MEDKIELAKKIAFFALIFALLSIGIAENLSPTNTTVGLRYVLNTTNLAPTIEPSSPGTGERVADNTTYWANDSPVDVSIWIHANTAGQNSQLKLYINGTEYQNVAGKPISVAEENNKSLFHTIPQYAYYSVVAANYHHYEWRETKILTGNVTTSLGAAGVRWIINNTNLAPHVVGGPDGTGERIADNTTYHNNNYPIEIFLYEHKNTIGLAPETYLYINDTLVTHANKSIVAIIPQYSKYSVYMENPLWYTWYEYPMLTGNVTTISGSGGSGCTGNCSFDHIRVNGIRKNNTTDPYNLYINLSSGFMSISTINPEFTFMDLNNGNNAIFGYYNASTGFSSNFYALHDSAEINAGNGTHSSIILNDSHIDLLPNSFSGANYSFNKSELNVSYRNITELSSIDGRNISLSNVISPLLQQKGSIHTNKILKYYDPFNVDITTSQTDNLFSYIFTTNPNVFNGVGLVSFQSVGNSSYPYFSGRRARGVDYGNGTAMLSALKEGDPFINYAGSGYDNGTGWTGTRAAMGFWASQDWTTSANGAKIVFSTTNNGTTSTASSKVVIESTGNMTFMKPDSGITLKSPDTNDWCVRVNNGGALYVTTGKCVR